jgi:hypothetical protein
MLPSSSRVPTRLRREAVQSAAETLRLAGVAIAGTVLVEPDGRAGPIGRPAVARRTSNRNSCSSGHGAASVTSGGEAAVPASADATGAAKAGAATAAARRPWRRQTTASAPGRASGSDKPARAAAPDSTVAHAPVPRSPQVIDRGPTALPATRPGRADSASSTDRSGSPGAATPATSRGSTDNPLPAGRPRAAAKAPGSRPSGHAASGR